MHLPAAFSSPRTMDGLSAATRDRASMKVWICARIVSRLESVAPPSVYLRGPELPATAQGLQEIITVIVRSHLNLWTSIPLDDNTSAWPCS
jgi:hypothetical protein